MLIIIIKSSPRAQLPNRCVASRHSTGFSLRWPGTRDGTASLRGECAIEGRNFHRPLWLFLIGVYSAHRGLTEFSSLRPNVRDSPAGWTFEIFTSVCGALLGLPCRSVSVLLRTASWLVCPSAAPFTVRSTNFVELCNISVYYFSSSDGCFGFITFWQGEQWFVKQTKLFLTFPFYAFKIFIKVRLEAHKRLGIGVSTKILLKNSSF